MDTKTTRNMQISITDSFWGHTRKLVRTQMIPYQWDVLNDRADITIEKERDDPGIPSEKSHAIENFRIAAGRAEGDHYGWVFQDSDVYKWLEAAAGSLRETPDEALRAEADSVVELIAAAQQPDGYLHTYFTIKEPERRYKRLGESHELYCAGHFLEAAVAYYTATGNELVLETAVKLADHLDAIFGAEEGKLRAVDGHEEVEIGLMKLYHLTGEKRYLDLADFFIRERGRDPELFIRQVKEDAKEPVIDGVYRFPLRYFQIHEPALQQTTAEGHAVRLVYLCTAMADLAASAPNEEARIACEAIWRNIVDKRMYITGGIGSTVTGEAFTLDYDLPNDTMYCETCASVGLIFFAAQMLRLAPRGEYADVMERALYNTALAGMALDGRHFFYVNPLEAVPAKSHLDPGKSHVKCVRPEWLGCACCPPNLARLLTSLEQYIYLAREEEILVNLFIASQMHAAYEGGELDLAMSCDYPRSGEIRIRADVHDADARVGIRIPGWVDGVSCTLDGKEALSQGAGADVRDGYLYLTLCPGGHEIGLDIAMTPKRWYANPKVSADVGKVAVCRGPQVFCAEEADNGADLHELYLPEEAPLSYSFEEDLLGGVGVIGCDGLRLSSEAPALYTTDRSSYTYRPQKIRLIPYYAWANRGENEMRVWLSFQQ